MFISSQKVLKNFIIKNVNTHPISVLLESIPSNQNREPARKGRKPLKRSFKAHFHWQIVMTETSQRAEIAMRGTVAKVGRIKADLELWFHIKLARLS